MKKIILFVAILEISYLSLSFALAEYYGQWNIIGETIRTGFRVISIAFYGYFYQKYFYDPGQTFNNNELLTPQFSAAILLFLLFGLAFTNAENETLYWQIVFVISGVSAGLREELFYRGIVQNYLQRHYDFKIALGHCHNHLHPFTYPIYLLRANRRLNVDSNGRLNFRLHLHLYPKHCFYRRCTRPVRCPAVG